MKYSNELIEMVRSLDNAEALMYAEAGNVSLQIVLSGIRPSADAAMLAEAIIDNGHFSKEVGDIADRVLRRLEACDLCTKETYAAMKAAYVSKPSTVHPDDAFMAGLREKYPNAKITRK